MTLKSLIATWIVAAILAGIDALLGGTAFIGRIAASMRS
jgi:hypothetical protein